MNWIKRALILLLSVLLCFGALSVVGHADFGDFSGDSDYGGWDSGGWDSGSDWDSDWDSGGSDSDNDSGGFVFFTPGAPTASDEETLYTMIALGVIAVIVFLVVWKKLGGKKAPRTTTIAGGKATDPATLRSVADYKTVDPQFDDAAFREKLANLYVQLQNSWEGKNLAPLRPYLSDAFYAQMDRQLEHYRQSRQTNRMERIAVLDVRLVGWKQAGGHDIMIARLRTRLVDYVVDDASGRLVRGSQTAEKFMTYEWQLERTSGVQTGASTGTTVHNCPNCGAALDVNHSAQCPYCDSILTVDTFDWVLTGIKGLAQETVGK
ncbi:MAG: TIM44-like domain-containing protein [Clostridia bacterium]|nr:TIM44-like domain-containing protein [Clostridia bacterium]